MCGYRCRSVVVVLLVLLALAGGGAGPVLAVGDAAGGAGSPAARSPADFPDGAGKTLDEYYRALGAGDGPALTALLCFTDSEDERLFRAFSPKDPTTLRDQKVFPLAKPAVWRKAADDCWLVLLEDRSLLELWQIGDSWRVLCPQTGRGRMAAAKLSRTETMQYLLSAEMQIVRAESNAQLERRRARYLAAMDLLRQGPFKPPTHYLYGMPAVDAATLAALPADKLREAVLLRLDAPCGLRYRVSLEKTAFSASEPVSVTFSLENVTTATLEVRFRPSVEIVDFNDAITARGALVYPRDVKGAPDRNPYAGQPAYPLAERTIQIAPGEPFTLKVDLRNYYDLRPAKYTVSSRLDVPRQEGGTSWQGYALANGAKFEVQP